MFEHFDLVPIRIGHEREPRHAFSSRSEFHQVAGTKALQLKAHMLGLQTVDRHREIWP